MCPSQQQLAQEQHSLPQEEPDSCLGLLELLLSLLRIPVEEEVDHNIPRLARDRSAETEDLTSKHPVQETDRVASLVVSRDCNIDESQRRVGIAESDDWDVHIRRLTNRLVVGARIGEDQQTRLHVLLLDLVSE